MATYDTAVGLNQYMLDNWIDTPIQFDGMVLDTTALTKWISVKYIPVQNDAVGLDGTTTGRIGYRGLFKVFCYAKNSTLAYKLADDVKTALNGKQIANLRIDIGQDRDAVDLDNTWYECLCLFSTTEQ